MGEILSQMSLIVYKAVHTNHSSMGNLKACCMYSTPPRTHQMNLNPESIHNHSSASPALLAAPLIPPFSFVVPLGTASTLSFAALSRCCCATPGHRNHPCC